MRKLFTILFLFCSVLAFGQMSGMKKLLLSQGVQLPDSTYISSFAVNYATGTSIGYTNKVNIDYNDYVIVFAASKAKETMQTGQLISTVEQDSSINLSSIVFAGYWTGASVTNWGYTVFGSQNTSRVSVTIVLKNVNILAGEQSKYKLDVAKLITTGWQIGGVNGDFGLDILISDRYTSTPVYSGDSWVANTYSDITTGWTVGIGKYEFTNDGQSSIISGFGYDSYHTRYAISVKN